MTDKGAIELENGALDDDVETLKEAVRFLLSFVPIWAKEVPDGLCGTMYGTCTAEGDRKVKTEVDEIRKLVDPPRNFQCPKCGWTWWRDRCCGRCGVPMKEVKE